MKTVISDYKVGTTFEINCTKQIHKNTNEVYYENFGIIEQLTCLWGRKKEDIIKVKCTIIQEDVIIEDLYKDKSYNCAGIDYFGYIDFSDKELQICMIYPNVYQYSICFPSGPDEVRFWKFDSIDHKAGDRHGMTVRLKIEEI